MILNGQTQNSMEETWNSVDNDYEQTEKALDALIPTWWQRILRWRPWPRKQRIISSPENEAPYNPFPSLEEQEQAYRDLLEIRDKAKCDGLEGFTRAEIRHYAKLLTRFNGVPTELAEEEARLRVQAIFKLTEQKYGR